MHWNWQWIRNTCCVWTLQYSGSIYKFINPSCSQYVLVSISKVGVVHSIKCLWELLIQTGEFIRAQDCNTLKWKMLTKGHSRPCKKPHQHNWIKKWSRKLGYIKPSNVKICEAYIGFSQALLYGLEYNSFFSTRDTYCMLYCGRTVL